MEFSGFFFMEVVTELFFGICHPFNNLMLDFHYIVVGL